MSIASHLVKNKTNNSTATPWNSLSSPEVHNQNPWQEIDGGSSVSLMNYFYNHTLLGYELIKGLDWLLFGEIFILILDDTVTW